MHVRHGLKFTEGALYNFSEYVQPLNLLAMGSQDLPILYKEVAEGNATFKYPPQRFAKRRLFLSTEDPAVVEEGLEPCGFVHHYNHYSFYDLWLLL